MIHKRIFQVMLYLVEVIGVSTLLAYISNRIFPVCSTFEYIQRIIDFYAVYQILIVGILAQLNDILKDQYLAIMNTYNYVKIYNKYETEDIRKDILAIIEKELDKKTFNDVDIRKEYEDMRECLENGKRMDDHIIDVKILKYSHNMDTVMLNWNFSLLSRLFK